MHVHSTIMRISCHAAGDLTMEQQRTICDVHSKKRLTSLLDVLRRMDLIRPFIFSANTFYSRSERSVFVAKALVSFQEPASPGESQARTPTSAHCY